MSLAPNRLFRRSGIALAATVFIIASLGGVANAATKVRHFQASLAPSCVVEGTRVTLTGTITNDTTSNQMLGSVFFDNSKSAFSHIDGTPPFVVTASAGKQWTALREDAIVKRTDRADLDGIYLEANSTADALSPGQSVTVTFQATVGTSAGNKPWTVAAWVNPTPRGAGGSFGLVGNGVAVQIAAACPATHLAFYGQPSNTQAGVAISPPVTVQVLDSTNTVVSSASNAITIAIGTNVGGGTLSGTETVNASGGTATFSDLSIDKAGSGYTLTASATGLTGDTSNAFDITSGTAENIAFVAPPSDTQAGGTMADVTVEVTDGSDNPVSGESVTLDSAGLATTPSAAQTTGADGIATFSGLTVSTVAGPYTMTASDAAASLTTDPAPFNVTVGAPAIAFTKQPTDTLVNEPIGGGDVEVTVADTFGNPVPDGTPVTMSLGVDPTLVATLGGTLTEQTSSGVATFTDLTIDTTSSGYQLRATSGSLQVDSDVFAITNTDSSCTTDCTATFPNGTSTVSAPAGTTLIVETNQLDCSGVESPIAGTVTIIPSGNGVVAVSFTDTVPLPVGGPYPFCKTTGPDDQTVQDVPLCSQVDGLNQDPDNGVACVTESVEFSGPHDTTATLHSTLYMDSTDPHAKH